MSRIQWDIEIKLTLPSSTLVTFPDIKNRKEYCENDNFRRIREYLDIQINIKNWYNRCVQISFGKKHLQKIELYYAKDERSYILLDNYRDPYDQLGLVSIGVKTTAELGNEIRKLTRNLNDESAFNVNYIEGSNSIFKLYPIDEHTMKRYSEPQISEYAKDKEVKIFRK